MNIESQVPSLELSKQLAELLGDKAPKSLFYWRTVTVFGKDRGLWICYGQKQDDGENTLYPAYTASELLELLPEKYVCYRSTIKQISKVEYICDDNKSDISQYAETLPDAMAKMLIHLLTNKMI